MLTFFKKYLKLKGIDHQYAIGNIDADGSKTLHLLNGEVSHHLAYKGERLKHNELYRISSATCIGSNGCTVGNPPEYCKGHHYSVNKCAVHFFDEVNLDEFYYYLTYDEFQKMKE